jgi:hypothetical protein
MGRAGGFAAENSAGGIFTALLRVKSFFASNYEDFVPVPTKPALDPCFSSNACSLISACGKTAAAN